MVKLILISIVGLALFSCKKETAKKNPPVQRSNQISEVISAAINSEDSAIRHEWHYLLEPKAGSGAEIFVSIYEKYYPAPNLDDIRYLDSNFIKRGVPKDLVERYRLNRDSVARFDWPLKIKFKYLYVADSLEKRPRFEIAYLPNKYVKKYCRFKLSKPTFNDDSTRCMFQMQNIEAGTGHLYYFEKSGQKWGNRIKSNIPSELYPENWVW